MDLIALSSDTHGDGSPALGRTGNDRQPSEVPSTQRPMSLAGQVGDVGIADVLQMISLAGRTGTLTVSASDSDFGIGFHEGRIAAATTSSTPGLGDLLVEEGVLQPDQLADALRLHESGASDELAVLLIEHNVVTEEVIRHAVEHRVIAVVKDLLVLEEGSFEFRLDVLPASTATRETTPLVRLDTQRVLFEAARIADESDIHDETALSYKRLFQDTSEMLALSSFSGTAAAPRIAGVVPDMTALKAPHEPSLRNAEASPVSPQPAPLPPGSMNEVLPPKLPELQVVSFDESFLAQLQTSLTLIATVVSRPLSAIDSSAGSSFVLLDLRRGQLGEDDVRTLVASNPSVPVIVVIDAGALPWNLFQAGALSVLPPDTEAIRCCLRSISRTTRYEPPAAKIDALGPRTLHSALSELRSGQLEGTVTLNLMRFLSEFVERAVFFLVRRKDLQLEALGGFGETSSGASIAEVTHGFRLPLEGESALSRAALAGLVHHPQGTEAADKRFVRLIGAPRDGESLILPIFGASRVMAVVYTDNGNTSQPIADVDLLELATEQFGMALENEFLRRRSLHLEEIASRLPGTSAL